MVDIHKEIKTWVGADGAALWSAAAAHAAGGQGGRGEQRQVGVSVRVQRTHVCMRTCAEDQVGGGRGVTTALPGSVAARGRRG